MRFVSERPVRSIRLGSTPTRTISFDNAYAPFGETYATSGTTDPSFTGQRQDTVAGLFDFPDRQYSTQGRWPTSDPLGLGSVRLSDPQTLNRYAYVRNNPLTFVDPTGLEIEKLDDWGDDDGGGGGGDFGAGDGKFGGGVAGFGDPTSGGDPLNGGANCAAGDSSCGGNIGDPSTNCMGPLINCADLGSSSVCPNNCGFPDGPPAPPWDPSNNPLAPPSQPAPLSNCSAYNDKNLNKTFEQGYTGATETFVEDMGWAIGGGAVLGCIAGLEFGPAGCAAGLSSGAIGGATSTLPIAAVHTSYKLLAPTAKYLFKEWWDGCRQQ
ncbi:MAG TPA: RHS repeat-associated core domain-containing protein [Candidatus Acidoferrum sp.]